MIADREQSALRAGEKYIAHSRRFQATRRDRRGENVGKIGDPVRFRHGSPSGNSGEIGEIFCGIDRQVMRFESPPDDVGPGALVIVEVIRMV